MRYAAQSGSGRERGSALVEGALVLGLFMMVVIAITQFSLILFCYNNATYASRVAMRYAVVHGSTSTSPATAATISGIISPLLWGAPSGGYTISTNWSPNNTPGSTVTISVTITYMPILPYATKRSFTIGTTAYGTVIQ